MRFFNTIFDSNYLFQGLTLYQSLIEQNSPFKIHVLCMDDLCLKMLRELDLPHLLPIPLSEVESYYPQLIHHKQKTTHGQYCWSMQPFICHYLLEVQNLEMTTYLEADSYFYSSWEEIFTEMEQTNADLTLIPHRYIKKFDQSKRSGKFCVQFNAFKNNKNAKEVLNRWSDACLNYNLKRPDHYPGQLFLDLVPKVFDHISIIKNLGAGLAPWNANQYSYEYRKENDILISDSDQQLHFKLIFYHFHLLLPTTQDGEFDVGPYPLKSFILDKIYRPYFHTYKQNQEMVLKKFPHFDKERKKSDSPKFVDIIKNPKIKTLRGFLAPYKSRLLGRQRLHRFP